MVRELYLADDGRVLQRPLPEVIAAFPETTATLDDLAMKSSPGRSRKPTTALRLARGKKVARVTASEPKDFLADFTVTLEEDSVFRLNFRRGEGQETMQCLEISTAENHIRLGTIDRHTDNTGPVNDRVHRVPVGKPIRVRLFAVGTIITAFVEDHVTLTMNALSLENTDLMPRLSPARSRSTTSPCARRRRSLARTAQAQARTIRPKTSSSSPSTISTPGRNSTIRPSPSRCRTSSGSRPAVLLQTGLLHRSRLRTLAGRGDERTAAHHHRDLQQSRTGWRTITATPSSCRSGSSARLPHLGRRKNPARRAATIGDPPPPDLRGFHARRKSFSPKTISTATRGNPSIYDWGLLDGKLGDDLTIDLAIEKIRADRNRSARFSGGWHLLAAPAALSPGPSISPATR